MNFPFNSVEKNDFFQYARVTSLVVKLFDILTTGATN